MRDFYAQRVLLRLKCVKFMFVRNVSSQQNMTQQFANVTETGLTTIKPTA